MDWDNRYLYALFLKRMRRTQTTKCMDGPPTRPFIRQEKRQTLQKDSKTRKAPSSLQTLTS